MVIKLKSSRHALKGCSPADQLAAFLVYLLSITKNKGPAVLLVLYFSVVFRRQLIIRRIRNAKTVRINVFTNLSLSLVMLSPPLVICLLAGLGAVFWLFQSPIKE